MASRQMKATGSRRLSQTAPITAPRTTKVNVPKVGAITALLLVLSTAFGAVVWLMFPQDPRLARNFGVGAGVATSSFGFIASFKPQWSTWLAPLYAIAGGLFMGGLALSFEARYPDIALQTVSVTGCVFVAALMR